MMQVRHHNASAVWVGVCWPRENASETESTFQISMYHHVYALYACGKQGLGLNAQPSTHLTGSITDVQVENAD
jgi:hypothetical protein